MPVVSISAERAGVLASGAYGRASLELIASYGVPFFIVKSGTISTHNLTANRELLSNGTAFIVDRGQGPIAVTANHVIDAAMEPTVETVGLFPKQFELPERPLLEINNLKERIIACSKERDIATFRISEEERDRLGVTALSTPPMVPLEGNGGVGFIGYPGTQRDIKSVRTSLDGPEMILRWAVFPGFGVAASVSDRQITFQFDRSELADPPPGFQHPDPNLDLGGMSGGPMLMKCETAAGIEYWAPAGVITQGKMSSDMNGGLLFASRLDDLQEDGRF